MGAWIYEYLKVLREFCNAPIKRGHFVEQFFKVLKALNHLLIISVTPLFFMNMFCDPLVYMTPIWKEMKVCYILFVIYLLQ